jgi:hypothetical protein
MNAECRNFANAFASLSMILALIVIGSGCSHTVDVAKIHPPYKISVYENATYSAERILPADSAQAREVSAWVESHKDGWSPSVVTYVPFRLIRGEEFELNFQRKTCTLNYRTGAGRTQVTRSIEDGNIPRVFDQGQ